MVSPPVCVWPGLLCSPTSQRRMASSGWMTSNKPAYFRATARQVPEVRSVVGVFDKGSVLTPSPLHLHPSSPSPPPSSCLAPSSLSFSFHAVLRQPKRNDTNMADQLGGTGEGRGNGRGMGKGRNSEGYG